ncbi:MAG: hypothetical protein EU541_05670 [Promethearchaeota archaeon]|nr:MAG: hypothetical protein EU541_05670 [Candidatus Lokiarchaeota archaeon]
MSFNDTEREEFHKFIIENNVIGFFENPIRLKSGRESYFYVNWRDITSDVYLIDKLTDFIIQFTTELNLSNPCFLGVPEGATKIGILTQYKWANSQENYKKNEYILSMARGKHKRHGKIKDRAYIGVPKGEIIVIEDVTTTGQSLLSLIDQLLQMDLNIVTAISLTNRDEKRNDGKTVEDIINERGVPLKSLSHAIDLLPKIFKLKHKSNEILAKKVEEYFKEFGIRPIKLLD